MATGINTTEPASSITWLHLFHIISPALPVGAFSYSQGLEYAIESQWIDKADLPDWLSGQLHFALCHTELPVLARCYQAYQQGDYDGYCRWSEFLLTSRETRELREQDIQLAWALKRLINHLGLELMVPPPQQLTYLALYAAYTAHHGIALQPAALGWLWNWLENQIAAASKLFPLGQTQAQNILYDLIPQLETAWHHSLAINESDIGATLPALSMASAWHETQYSRLFRS